MLEVGWWGVGVIKGSFQKHLKTGVGKGKSCSYGGLMVSPPLPPPEDFNHTLGLLCHKRVMISKR